MFNGLTARKQGSAVSKLSKLDSPQEATCRENIVQIGQFKCWEKKNISLKEKCHIESSFCLWDFFPDRCSLFAQLKALNLCPPAFSQL